MMMMMMMVMIDDGDDDDDGDEIWTDRDRYKQWTRRFRAPDINRYKQI